MHPVYLSHCQTGFLIANVVYSVLLSCASRVIMREVAVCQCWRERFCNAVNTM